MPITLEQAKALATQFHAAHTLEGAFTAELYKSFQSQIEFRGFCAADLLKKLADAAARARRDLFEDVMIIIVFFGERGNSINRHLPSLGAAAQNLLNPIITTYGIEDKIAEIGDPARPLSVTPSRFCVINPTFAVEFMKQCKNFRIPIEQLSINRDNEFPRYLCSSLFPSCVPRPGSKVIREDVEYELQLVTYNELIDAHCFFEMTFSSQMNFKGLPGTALQRKAKMRQFAYAASTGSLATTENQFAALFRWKLLVIDEENELNTTRAVEEFANAYEAEFLT